LTMPGTDRRCLSCWGLLASWIAILLLGYLIGVISHRQDKPEVDLAVPTWGAVRNMTTADVRIKVLPLSESTDPFPCREETIVVHAGKANSYTPRIEPPFSFDDVHLIVWAVPIDPDANVAPQLFDLHFPEKQPHWERRESGKPYWGLIILRDRREDSVVKSWYDVEDLPPALIEE